MSISIIIPTIGSPSREIIKESVESALNSCPTLWSQIIVIDNSRSPKFHQFLSEICSTDGRVEIYSIDEPLTMASCWNKGLEYVKNEWLLYLHDDDILLSQNITSDDLNSKGAFINFGFEVFGQENWVYTPQIVGLEGICHNTPKFVSTLIKTKSLTAIGQWDDLSGYFLDFLAFIKMDSHFGSDLNKKTLGRYRLHSSNASMKNKRNETYGDQLPHTLSEIFKLVKSEKERREVLYSMLSFTYPNNSTSKKIISNLIKSAGYKAWLK